MNIRIVEIRLQHQRRFANFLWSDVVVAFDAMRSAADGFVAEIRQGFCHGDGFIDGDGAVVDRWEYVAVEVDHLFSQEKHLGYRLRDQGQG